MKKDDVEMMLGGLVPPNPDKISHQDELKIPLLRYTRSSKAGLWLLILPVIVAITYVLKYELMISSTLVDGIRSFFAAVDGNPALTYLIPIIFIGLPSTAIVINVLACAHITRVRERNELLVTIKYRLVNFAIILLSFAILVFFLLPDKLSF